MACLNPVGPTLPPRTCRQRRGVRTTRLRRPQQHLSSAHSVIAHKSFDSPCNPIARKTLPRPPHPVPYVRDDRETPLCVGRDGQSSRGDLGWVETETFLQRGLDTPVNKPPDGQIT